MQSAIFVCACKKCRVVCVCLMNDAPVCGERWRRLSIFVHACYKLRQCIIIGPYCSTVVVDLLTSLLARVGVFLTVWLYLCLCGSFFSGCQLSLQLLCHL